MKVLEQQIAYDAEEIELKHQLAWARVHISEQESAEMARKIATRIEVLILLLRNFLNIRCFIVKCDFFKEMKIPESKLEETERELNDLETAREEALENLDKERKR